MLCGVDLERETFEVSHSPSKGHIFVNTSKLRVSKRQVNLYVWLLGNFDGLLNVHTAAILSISKLTHD